MIASASLFCTNDEEDLYGPMQIMVAGDNRALSPLIREQLQRCGVSAEQSDFRPLDEAVDHIVQGRPELVLFVLSPDVERSLRVLREALPLMPASRVLAIGPAQDPRLILRVLKEGVAQYIDEQEIATELSDGLSRSRYRLPDQSGDGQTITVLGVTGGCGASTVAVNLATALARKHGMSGLVDLDLETGDLAPLLNMQPRYSVADFCRNLDRMDSVMFDQCFARHESGVHLLAAPSKYREIGDVTPEGVRRLLHLARGRFPFVIVDFHQTYRPDQAQALFQAENILVVLRPDFTSLRHAARTMGYLEDLNIDLSRVQLVTNRQGLPRQLSLAEVQTALGRKVAFAVPEDAKCMNRASNKGTPIILDAPRSSSARTLAHLATCLDGASLRGN